jgi:hypothetical protein
MPKVGSAIYGLAIRVKRLDANGNPTGDEVVTDGFVKVGASVRSQTGTEITVRNASGGICVQKKTPDQVTGSDITIDFCQVLPECFDIVSTVNPVENCDGDIAGFQQGTAAKSGFFSLEIWSEANGGTLGAYVYSLYPKVAIGMVGGSVEWADSAQTWTLSAPAEANPNWGSGTDLVAHAAGITSVIMPTDSGAVVLCDPVDADSFFYSVATNVKPPGMDAAGAMNSVVHFAIGAALMDDKTTSVFGATTPPITVTALGTDAAFGDSGTAAPNHGAAAADPKWAPDDYVALTPTIKATWDGTKWIAFVPKP